MMHSGKDGSGANPLNEVIPLLVPRMNFWPLES